MSDEKRPGLAQMWAYNAPNLLILSRAADPPVARLRRDDEVDDAKENAPVDCESSEGNKRELRGMSARSSINIAKVLSSLDWRKHGECIHLTLTYWREWPKGKQEITHEKASLVALVGRHVECGVWRLEFQRRETEAEKAGRKATGRARRKSDGSLYVPHWHLLLWLGGRDAEDVERWLRKWWARFASNPHERGVSITTGDQARGVWYLALHAAKREQSPPFAVGRWWGYVSRDVLLSAQDLHKVDHVTERERVWWARLYRRATGCRTRPNMGFSWFIPRAWQCAAASWIRDYTEAEQLHRAAGCDPEWLRRALGTKFRKHKIPF